MGCCPVPPSPGVDVPILYPSRGGLTRGQTAIEGDLLRAPKVGQVPCEWCGEPSTGSVPIYHKIRRKKDQLVATGMHVYFCPRHRGAAERMTGARRDA